MAHVRPQLPVQPESRDGQDTKLENGVVSGNKELLAFAVFSKVLG